jgi:hypothetical protein
MINCVLRMELLLGKLKSLYLFYFLSDFRQTKFERLELKKKNLSYVLFYESGSGSGWLNCVLKYRTSVGKTEILVTFLFFKRFWSNKVWEVANVFLIKNLSYVLFYESGSGSGWLNCVLKYRTSVGKTEILVTFLFFKRFSSNKVWEVANVFLIKNLSYVRCWPKSSHWSARAGKAYVVRS